MRIKLKEKCNECGRSVAPGSKNFTNRVISFESYSGHKKMGKPFPEGGYMCSQCDAGYEFDIPLTEKELKQMLNNGRDYRWIIEGIKVHIYNIDFNFTKVKE